MCPCSHQSMARAAKPPFSAGVTNFSATQRRNLGLEGLHHPSRFPNTKWQSQALNPASKKVGISVLASLLCACVTPLL